MMEKEWQKAAIGQQARKQNIYLIAEVDRLEKELDDTFSKASEEIIKELSKKEEE